MILKTPFCGHKQNKLEAVTVHTVSVQIARHCAWGTCTNYERYPEKWKSVHLFHYPKTDLDKCLL